MKAAALLALLLVGCTPQPTCQQARETAAVALQAAQVCTTELVGCSLSFEDVKQTIRDQRAAQAVCQ